MIDIVKLRQEFPVSKKLIYFNHAAVGPLPLCSAGKVEGFLKDNVTNGCLNYKEWMVYQDKVRGLAARLVGADKSEIAFVKNTSTGISMVAEGLDWRQGDNVIIPDTEFPANVYPWLNLKRKGVEVRMVKTDAGRFYPEAFEALIDERTRLISVSWVEFSTGFKNDLKALGDISRKRNVLLCVDAIQGLGVLDMDVKEWGIDFLAADGHKWLLAPEGIGILYVSKDVIDNLHPVFVGWNSVEDAVDYLPYHFEKLKKNTLKFEEGSPNLLGTFALGASLELLLDTGIKVIETRVINLTDQLVEGLKEHGYRILSPRGEGEKSGIIVFTGGQRDEDLHNHLGKNKIFCALRGGGIRLSPHFYNTKEEVAKFLKILPRIGK